MTSTGTRQPDLAHHYYDDGMAQLSTGDEQGARQSFLKAIARDDSLAIAHYQLGNCLRRCGEQIAAEQALKAAIRNDASISDAYISLAYLYHSQGKSDLAASTLSILVKAHPTNTTLRLQVAGLLADMGCHQQAIPLYQGCLHHDHRDSQTHLRLGQSLQKLGRFKEAAQSYLQALEADPNNDAAYLLLAHTRRLGTADAQLIRRFETVLTNPRLSEESIKCIHFSLGKMNDDLNNYDEAFTHFRIANELQHRRVQFDRHALVNYVASVKHVFTRNFFQSRFVGDSSSPTPVFIVGMLRSGTTLVERILASHPQVSGLGETERVDQLAETLAMRLHAPYPECMLRLTKDEASGTRAELQTQQPTGTHAATYLVDKNPLNFMHLGLIASVFPDAPILHCVRDPLDTCLSIYFQYFAHPRNNYAYDLDDIGFFYTQYLKLMQHWHAVLPVPIYTVQYEELVEHPEKVTRSLLSAISLPWDPACLEPHKHTASIATASLWQARQPIYTSAVGRWHHYSSRLDALRDALKAADVQLKPG
jgi:tetratricopeptide (TPR) repeat protein